MRYIIFSFVSLLLLSCGKSPAELLAEQDKEIRQYLANHNLESKVTSTGLHYVIQKEGNGKFPGPTSDVKVKYKGNLLDGTVFDAGILNKTNLQRVIKGWTEGIPLFSEGGEGILLIPSYLGYGSKQAGTIPANSVLIFEIELIKIL